RAQPGNVPGVLIVKLGIPLLAHPNDPPRLTPSPPLVAKPTLLSVFPIKSTFPRSVVKNPSICKGETPRSIVYAPQEVAGHARSAKTEGQHVSDGDQRGACAQRPFPATSGCRGGLFVHSRARSPFVL